MQPLLTTVLDLDHALGSTSPLLIGGGLGLYLKEQFLRGSGVATLFPLERMPPARATRDIDLFLREEVIRDRDLFIRFRDALHRLGFVVDERARWLRFRRLIHSISVELDVMVGPIDSEPGIHRHGNRLRPRGVAGLHARITGEALGIEVNPTEIVLSGHLGDGSRHTCTVLVPGAFPYALMKLGALRDRIHDKDRDEARHHALDLLRIVAMLTEEEERQSQSLADRNAAMPVVIEAQRVLKELFAPAAGIGRIRLREHPLCPADIDLDGVVREMQSIISGPGQSARGT